MEHITINTRQGSFPGAVDLYVCYGSVRRPYGEILVDWFIGREKKTSIQVLRDYFSLRDRCLEE